MSSPSAPAATGHPTRATRPGAGPDFAQELDLAALPIHISHHAQRRLESRNINLGPDEIERLRGAVETLSRRGAHDSVVMLGSLALVVNVPSATVLTAVEPNARKESVFTNIDSLLIA